MKEVLSGEVCWFSNGFGFISYEINSVKQKDMFVHFSDIAMDGFKNLAKGQKVTFEIGLNNRNQPKAINVHLVA